jgi:hypothetical protein
MSIENIQDKLEVDTSIYLSIPEPERIKRKLVINLDSRCFLPRIDDLQSDWVSHIAAPAFKLIRRHLGEDAGSFCTIGTGCGLDALAAVEILGARRIGLTDVHDGVVSTASANVANNVNTGFGVTLEAGCGDLLQPLERYEPRYDVIYENLPNVPADSPSKASDGRNSSTHLPPRAEKIPELVKSHLLDLHYLALVQARSFLENKGSVISTLGGRVPLEVFIEMGDIAGYSSSILTYSWKVQAVAESVIIGHAEKQKEGYGPFFFYDADLLERIFGSVDINDSGPRAFEIERDLLPYRLDAPSAFEAFRKGMRIGHTVAVLKSE